MKVTTAVKSYFKSIQINRAHIFIKGDTGETVHYCGSRLPQPFRSSGRSVQLIFYTDATSDGKGFSLQYSVECKSRDF